MARLLPLLLSCVIGCAFTATEDSSPATARTVAPATPPPIRLAHGLTATAPQPGRYEMRVQLHTFSSCSRSWASYDSTATLKLDLDPRGHASACRTRDASHSDPDGHFVFALRHAYRGSWRRDGAWVTVDLQPASDPSCPDRAERPHEEPAAWHLRCIEVTPGPEHADFQMPALACRFAPEPGGETLGFVVQTAIDDTSAWMLLGPSPGLSITANDEGLGAQTLLVQRL